MKATLHTDLDRLLREAARKGNQPADLEALADLLLGKKALGPMRRGTPGGAARDLFGLDDGLDDGLDYEAIATD